MHYLPTRLSPVLCIRMRPVKLGLSDMSVCVCTVTTVPVSIIMPVLKKLSVCSATSLQQLDWSCDVASPAGQLVMKQMYPELHSLSV